MSIKISERVVNLSNHKTNITIYFSYATIIYSYFTKIFSFIEINRHPTRSRVTISYNKSVSLNNNRQTNN
jgi:hypothetical protein